MHRVVLEQQRVPPMGGGNPCPGLTQLQECAVQCKAGPWGAWHACVESGERAGQRKRVREQIVAAQNLGRPCVLEEWGSCSVDCDVSAWGAWSPCSPIMWMNVRFHVRAKTRVVRVEPENGGTPCPLLVKQEQCPETTAAPPVETTSTAPEVPEPVTTASPHPVDCVVSGWGNWSDCHSETARQRRSRIVVVSASGGGASCPAVLRRLC